MLLFVRLRLMAGASCRLPVVGTAAGATASLVAIVGGSSVAGTGVRGVAEASQPFGGVQAGQVVRVGVVGPVREAGAGRTASRLRVAKVRQGSSGAAARRANRTGWRASSCHRVGRTSSRRASDSCTGKAASTRSRSPTRYDNRVEYGPFRASDRGRGRWRPNRPGRLDVNSRSSALPGPSAPSTRTASPRPSGNPRGRPSARDQRTVTG